MLYLYLCSIFTAPGLPDALSVVSVYSRNITLSWTLPEENGRNGIITSYMVTCTDEDGVSTSLTTSGVTATVGGLSPYSPYVCSVSASTSAGAGPPVTASLTTATDGNAEASSEIRCRFARM